jgi:hypothetical protein
MSEQAREPGARSPEPVREPGAWSPEPVREPGAYFGNGSVNPAQITRAARWTWRRSRCHHVAVGASCVSGLAAVVFGDSSGGRTSAGMRLSLPPGVESRPARRVSAGIAEIAP